MLQSSKDSSPLDIPVFDMTGLADPVLETTHVQASLSNCFGSFDRCFDGGPCFTYNWDGGDSHLQECLEGLKSDGAQNFGQFVETLGHILGYFLYNWKVAMTFARKPWVAVVVIHCHTVRKFVGLLDEVNTLQTAGRISFP